MMGGPGTPGELDLFATINLASTSGRRCRHGPSPPSTRRRSRGWIWRRPRARSRRRARASGGSK